MVAEHARRPVPRLALDPLDLRHKVGEALPGVVQHLEHPHGSHLERAALDEDAAGCEGDLDAAATDVDEDGLALGYVDLAGDSKMHEPGLFEAADDVHLDARLRVDAVEQIGTVFGLAEGTRADGDSVLDTPFVDGVAEAPERLGRRLHYLAGHPPAGEHVLAEPHGLARVLDDLDPAIPAGSADNEAHGVGTGVDGG